MDVEELKPGSRYDLAILGPWGMRIDYLNVSYDGPIGSNRTNVKGDPAKILLFWAEIDAKFGPIPVTAVPTQVLLVKSR